MSAGGEGARTVAVLGGGAWGSALASTLAAGGHDVRIWTRGAGQAEALAAGESPALGMAVTAPRLATTDIEEALGGADRVLAALPASATDATIDLLDGRIGGEVPVAWAAKGLVPAGDELIPAHAARRLPNPAVVLSGPSFADEVAVGKPAALVSASDDPVAAQGIAGLFRGGKVRVYTSADPVGVAVGGAVKNVIAIASGIVGGIGLGDNARAALVTRGLAETARFAVALGGEPETLSGLAGLGDMVLTCSGPHSRNYALGLALSSGEPEPPKLAEGRHSASVIRRRAESLGVDMPITAAVARVLDEGADIRDEVDRLMRRPVEGE